MADMEPNETQRLLAELNALLRLKTTVIGMKLFETVEEMEAIPQDPPAEDASTPPTRSSPRRASSAGRWASRWPTSSARSAGR